MAKIYDIEKQVNLLYRLKLWLEEVYGKNVDKIQEYKDICEHLDSIDLKEIKIPNTINNYKMELKRTEQWTEMKDNNY